MKKLILLMLVFGILMFGCAQQSTPQGTNNAPSTVQAQPPATAPQWETYKQKTFSFDHPTGLGVQESLANYSDGNGFATVAMGDNKSLIFVVAYMKLSPPLNGTAQDVAKSMLQADDAARDPMGILDLVANRSAVMTSTSANGYGVAEMTFNAPLGGKMLPGYAIQVFDPVTSVSVKARIVDTSESAAKSAADRFVQTLKLG